MIQNTAPAMLNWVANAQAEIAKNAVFEANALFNARFSRFVNGFISELICCLTMDIQDYVDAK